MSVKGTERSTQEGGSRRMLVTSFLVCFRVVGCPRLPLLF